MCNFLAAVVVSLAAAGFAPAMVSASSVVGAGASDVPGATSPHKSESVAPVKTDADWLARARAALPRHTARDFGRAPSVPEGPLSAVLAADVEVVFGDGLIGSAWKSEQTSALGRIAASGDVRLAWLISDLMRIAGDPRLMALLSFSASQLLGVEVGHESPWGATVDILIAWDVPAPPDYLPAKRRIYTLVEPGWAPLFAEGDIDWRHVSWGGVRIDNRPYDSTNVPCNCIPAADNPEVTDVDGGSWLPDAAVVFGVSINGEHRAYPRHIMEVREMVNDTLGGRHIAMPYCTLCGSAQVYFTDRQGPGIERPVMRTSGLLIRSNKVMYDLNTYSIFDTFLGKAVTGELAQKGVVLKQGGVVTTTWGEWKAAHPDTTVLVDWLALGQNPDFRNTRDANGPIFPVGDVDPRLAVHEDVLGIVTESGTPVAFHVGTARQFLQKGGEIAVENVRIVLAAGGIKALDAVGVDLGGHQAFWFAWSQFHPGTRLWPFTAE